MFPCARHEGTALSRFIAANVFNPGEATSVQLHVPVTLGPLNDPPPPHPPSREYLLVRKLDGSQS